MNIHLKQVRLQVKKADDDEFEDVLIAPAAAKEQKTDSPAVNQTPVIPENSTTAAANELFAQLAGMKGR